MTACQASFFNQTLFGTDFTPLSELSKQEAFEQPIVGLINPATLVASEICPQTFDFYTLTNEELQDFTLDLDWYMPKTCLVHGVSLLDQLLERTFLIFSGTIQIASWFDLNFAPPRGTEPSADPVNDNLHRQWDEAASPTGIWAYDTSMNPAELPPPPSDGLSVTLDTGPYGKRCAILDP